MIPTTTTGLVDEEVHNVTISRRSIYSSIHLITKAYKDTESDLTIQLTEARSQIDEFKSYINELEALLKQHGIPHIDRANFIKATTSTSLTHHHKTLLGIMKETNTENVKRVIKNFKELFRPESYTMCYHNLGVWTMAAPPEINTVFRSFKNLFYPVPKKRYDILKGLTGRILPGRLTLLIGPPNSGKSTFLKCLSGDKQSLHIDGTIHINDEDIFNTDKFLMSKLAVYTEQGDSHFPTFSVKETISLAWECTSGGEVYVCICCD